MCSQAVGLAAAEIERRGIPTAAIQLLRESAERVRPPRALLVPFPFGYPLEAPNDPEKQRAVLEALLALIERPGPPPVLEEHRPGLAPPPESTSSSGEGHSNERIKQ
jgi:hypothetical protein